MPVPQGLHPEHLQDLKRAPKRMLRLRAAWLRFCYLPRLAQSFRSFLLTCAAALCFGQIAYFQGLHLLAAIGIACAEFFLPTSNFCIVLTPDTCPCWASLYRVPHIRGRVPLCVSVAAAGREEAADTEGGGGTACPARTPVQQQEKARDHAAVRRFCQGEPGAGQDGWRQGGVSSRVCGGAVVEYLSKAVCF